MCYKPQMANRLPRGPKKWKNSQQPRDVKNQQNFINQNSFDGPHVSTMSSRTVGMPSLLDAPQGNMIESHSEVGANIVASEKVLPDLTFIGISKRGKINEIKAHFAEGSRFAVETRSDIINVDAGEEMSMQIA